MNAHLKGPVVSVIVPACNAESMLPITLDSVLAQTEEAWECLVVDDGSTDGTADVVRCYERADSRFRLIQQENLGVGAARNEGIRQAKGEFIAPLDADDLWMPGKLEKQLGRMREEGPECGLVYCWSNRIDERGDFMWRCRPFDVEGNVFEALLMWNFIGNASVPLLRAETLGRMSPYLTRAEQGGAQGCEDWDLSLRMAGCSRFAVVHDYLVEYRQVNPCMSGDVRGMAKSYRVLINRMCRNESSVPRQVFRWSAGHFHAYLAGRAYVTGKHGEVLRHIAESVASDGAMLINRRLYSYGFKSLVKLVLGRGLGIRRRRPRKVPEVSEPDESRKQPEARSLLEALQERRWATVIGLTKGTGT